MIIECRPVKAESIVDQLHLVDVWSVEAGLETMLNIVDGSYAFDVINEAGEAIGTYALRSQNCPNGVIAWLVVGQGNAPGADLTRDLLPAIERQAEGANYLAIQTQRHGLIAKLLKQGYQVGGTILVKKLK